jgi:hypothetical protein
MSPSPGLSILDAFNLAASITSIILAVLAIILSLLFFVRGKDSERLVTNALEGIRTQTDALQKLTGRWMDRLTRYATERPGEETLLILMQTLREMPASLANVFRPPAPADTADVEGLRAHAIIGYIGTFYYAALTNLWSQGYLPVDPPDADDPTRRVVDQSFARPVTDAVPIWQGDIRTAARRSIHLIGFP